MDIDSARPTEVVVVPDLGQDLFPAPHLVRMLEEEAEQLGHDRDAYAESSHAIDDPCQQTGHYAHMHILA
jgi:hypothetical protein